MSAVVIPSSPSSEALPSRALVSPGEVIAGRYLVGPLLGASHRALVYRAKHIGLGFPVSLQVLGPDVARNSLTWRRFGQELRALGALHNEHVVRVHDAGTLRSGVRFLITERLEGEDLATVLRKGPLPVDRAADYVCQVCSALADAHRLGIVHRNVRPENVFLARTRASQPAVKLLDFGVALFLEGPDQLTLQGCGCVTPGELSPEQLRNPNAVNHRSDLWSVGMLLFEALVGRSPFNGFTSAQILRALSEGPMPLLPLACASIPSELAALVQHCLERDPARRPTCADEIIERLEPFSSRPGRRARVLATPSPPATQRLTVRPGQALS